jgi:hypothetical protein
MKNILKEALNEKTIAMLVLTAIAFGAYYYLGPAAKEVVMPIVTGICSFVTGYVAGQAVSALTKPGITTETRPGKEVQ